MYKLKSLLYLFLFLISNQSLAFDELQDILTYEKQPEGVVIEITSGDKLYLEKIIVELKKDISALQSKYKNLPIAIVSHAKESLLLTKKAGLSHPTLHNEVKSLSNSGDTTIHVCGTYASWHNVMEDDFPDYINVSPAGPVQVNDYIDIGYIHIEL